MSLLMFTHILTLFSPFFACIIFQTANEGSHPNTHRYTHLTLFLIEKGSFLWKSCFKKTLILCTVFPPWQEIINIYLKSLLRHLIADLDCHKSETHRNKKDMHLYMLLCMCGSVRVGLLWLWSPMPAISSFSLYVKFHCNLHPDPGMLQWK